MAKEYSYGTCLYYINENNVYILLIQPKGHTEWGFCKGKIEQNETIEECAIRETFEEIGIKINKNELEDYFIQNNKRKDVGVFLVNIKNIDNKQLLKINNSEVFRIKLFNINDEISIYKNQSAILNNLKNYFKGVIN